MDRSPPAVIVRGPANGRALRVISFIVIIIVIISSSIPSITMLLLLLLQVLCVL